MKVGFISLGCSKNLVDTELIIGKFKEKKFEIVNDPKEAEIIVINTCGFIESAKQEAIDTIFEMAEYKKEKCKYLVAIGCLVQRYYEELVSLMPEVDLFIKIDDYEKLWQKISEMIENNDTKKSPIKTSKRVITTGKNYAYLKIAEGCSNYCTYCAIPYIRGNFRSRPMEEIIDEANMLAKKGIKELIVIAQDTTKYGTDLYNEPKLAELLEKLCQIEGIHWIRFLYSYPEGIDDNLIKVVKKQEKIAKYFDIPIQHISDEILKRMNRKTSKSNIERLIKKIRQEIPECTLRTSLIVGFPGETEEQFDELYKFVNEAKFDKLGVFEYSKEDGTPASTMPNQVHYKTKRKRLNKIMQAQQEISKEKMKQKIGSKQEVLVESKTRDGKYYVGRTKGDCPEIDGIVYIKNKNLELNKFVECKIVDFEEYDLIGE